MRHHICVAVNDATTNQLSIEQPAASSSNIGCRRCIAVGTRSRQRDPGMGPHGALLVTQARQRSQGTPRTHAWGALGGRARRFAP